MKRAVTLTLLLLSLVGLACNTLTRAISAPSSGEVVYSDDFSDASSGWEQGEYDTGSVGYESGVYSVVSHGDGDTMWGIADRNYSDVIIEVQATQIDAPANDNNDYGVMCRLQNDNDGYFLLISGDGYYSILLRSGGTFSPLVDWTSSDAFNLGNATNQIRAVCEGNTFTLIVNGTELASVRDSTFSSGDIALTATSYEAEPTEVHFDNLRVLVP